MANTAQLFRRQSSRDILGARDHAASHPSYTRTLDALELKVMWSMLS